MKTLIVGASGATGLHLVEQLLGLGHEVRAIVRSPEKFTTAIKPQDKLTVIAASVHDLSDSEMIKHVEGCDAVASCLGHNMSLKGVYGKPRRLVTDVTQRLCQAVRANHAGQETRFVLMNTAGNSNRDLQESVSFGEKIVIGLLRLMLPPHVDNEKASDFLRQNVGQDDQAIEWVVVRPDNLVNEEEVTDYDAFASPVRSAIFDAGTTSRINVGHFMAMLMTDDELWRKWKGQMPVIYNKA